MASTSKRSSIDCSPCVWTAGASVGSSGGPGNGGWPSPAQSAMACEASMHIKERNRGIYSATKKGGADRSAPPREETMHCAHYLTGEEKLASPSSTSAQAQ